MFTLSYGPPTSVNPTSPCESLSWLHVILVFVQGNQHEHVYEARIRTWETHQWRQQAFPPSAIPQTPIVPQGRVGLYEPLLAINEYWLTWAVSCRPGAYSCSELLIPAAMSCPFPHHLALVLFQFLLLWCLGIWFTAENIQWSLYCSTVNSQRSLRSLSLATKRSFSD